MTRVKCDQIAVFPQPPHLPTCWFNAVIMMVLYSEHSRNMLLENQGQWSPMSPNLKGLFQRFLHEKTRSNDHVFFHTHNPEMLLKLLHKENPRDFHVRTPRPGNPTYYLPHLFNLLGATSLHLDARPTGEGVVDLHANVNHLVYSWMQFSRGDVIQEEERMSRDEALDTIDIDKEYDYLTVRFVDSPVQHKLLMKDVRQERIITDGGFRVGSTRYVLDSVYMTNTNRPRSHAIAGITCDGVRYVYNGYPSSTQRCLPLYKFDWIHEDRCLGLHERDGFSICKYPSSLSRADYNLIYEAHKGSRTYTFVNEKYVRPATPPTSPIRYTRTPPPVPPGWNRPPPSVVTRPAWVTPQQQQRARRPPTPRRRPPLKPRLKACPPGKIRNPRTNRCVKKEGKVGKQVVQEQRQRRKRR